MCYTISATHFNILKSGHTNGKNVCSRLVLGKCVATLRGAFFGAPSTGAFFINNYWRLILSQKILKKFVILVALLIVGAIILPACDLFGNSNVDDINKYETEIENPITKVTLNNSNTTLVVGETLLLSYSITPTNSDEELEISVGDTRIVELVDNYIIAKAVGETYVSFKVPSDKSNMISKEIHIRVINEFDYTTFKSNYSTKIERATLTISCKRYNKNWLGMEKDVYTVTGSGTIIKSAAYANYFLTDKSIFNSVNKNYDYEEWFVKDYLGNTYKIAGIQYDTYSGIALGSFTSSTTYAVIDVFDSYAYKGDYAITAIGNPLTSRVYSTGYEKILSSTSNVFYHQSAFSSKMVGIAVLNHKCEIIGINVKYTNNNATAVSAIEIRRLIDRVFNGAPSGGGPIDII